MRTTLGRRVMSPSSWPGRPASPVDRRPAGNRSARRPVAAVAPLLVPHVVVDPAREVAAEVGDRVPAVVVVEPPVRHHGGDQDRKSTRLNSSHEKNSYADF